ncbi:MAG: phage tail protein [Chloroflexi bacterium]|nr:phage tail protein [Chloroflexota bacterium]
MQQSFVVKAASEPSPALAFKFWVEIENIVVAEFKECSGLRMERKVEPIKEGGVNDHVHFLPGRVEYSNIVLKYGVTDSTKLWDWFNEGLYNGKVKRVNFSILLRNVEGDVLRRWNVDQGFPVKWEGPQLNAETSQVTIETLEIAHDGLKLGQ